MNRHGNHVEWALHCAATLASLGPGERLSAGALAELFQVPPKYLAKALQALARAGVVSSTPGPRGGYSLARPASAVRLIDVVDAVKGGGRLFHCQEIRRRGPCRAVAAKHFSRTCGLAEAMWRAEAAWRKELESVTLAQAGDRFRREAPPVIVNVLGEWVRRHTT